MPSFIIHILPSRKEFKYCLRQWTSHKSSNFRNNSVIRQIWDIWYIWSYEHRSQPICNRHTKYNHHDQPHCHNYCYFHRHRHCHPWHQVNCYRKSFWCQQMPFFSLKYSRKLSHLDCDLLFVKEKIIQKVVVKPLYIILKDMGDFRIQPRGSWSMSVIEYIYHSQAYTLRLWNCSKFNSDMFDSHNSMITLFSTCPPF